MREADQDVGEQDERHTQPTDNFDESSVIFHQQIACARSGSLKIIERDTRIELASQPWKGRVLPLYESRRYLGYSRKKRG